MLVVWFRKRTAMANPPRTPSRTSALFAAAARGNLSSLRIVLEHGIGEGINVDSTDSHGDTPLHEACRNRQWPTAAWLLTQGANPDMVNALGQDARDVCPDAAGKDIYAAILAGNPLHAHQGAALGTTINSARAKATEELKAFERDLLAKHAEYESRSPAGRPASTDTRIGDEFSFDNDHGRTTPEAMGGHRVNRRMESDFDLRANANVSPSPGGVPAAIDSAMKRARDVLATSPEALYRAASLVERSTPPSTPVRVVDEDLNADPVSPEMFGATPTRVPVSSSVGTAAAIKAEMQSARKNMAAIRQHVDEQLREATSPVPLGRRRKVRGGDDAYPSAPGTPTAAAADTPQAMRDLVRQMFGDAPRISLDGKRVDGGAEGAEEGADVFDEESDPEEAVPIRRGVIRKAALAVTEQGVKLQRANRKIANLENAAKERDDFERESRENHKLLEESRRELRTLRERLDAESKERKRSDDRRAELEHDLDALRSELTAERGARRAAETRQRTHEWDVDDAKRSIEEANAEERRRSVALADLNARLEDARGTLASTEAALREARYGLQTECNRAAAAEAELEAASRDRDDARSDAEEARRTLEAVTRENSENLEHAASYQAKSEALTEECEALKHRLAASKAQTSSALELGEMASLRVDELERDASRRIAEVSRLESENERLRKADDDARATDEASRARCRDLESQLKLAMSDLDFTKVKLEGAERERDFAENRLAESGAETDRLRDLKEATAIELSKNRELSESNFVLTEKLAHATSELETLRVEVESSRDAMAKASDAEESRRQRALQRVAGRLMNRGKSMAFARWKESTDESKRLKAALRRAVGKFANASLARAMSRWRDVIGAKKDGNRAEKLLQRHFGRFASRSKSACFTGWRAEAKKGARLRVLVQKLTGRFDGRMTRRMFTHWKVHLTENAKRNRVLGRIVDRMRGRVVGASFDTWRDAIRERKELKRRIGKVLARFQGRASARAFDRWASTVDERRKMRASLARTLARFANRATASAFATWQDSIDEAKRLKALMHRVASKLANRAMAGAWESWLEMIEEKRSMHDALTRAVRKMQNRAAASAFASWADSVEEAKRLRGVLRRVAAKFANRRVAAAWETWYGVCEAKRVEEEEKQRLLNSVVARLTRGAVARSFARWAENVHARRAEAESAQTEERRRADVLNRAVRRLANRALAGAFAKWVKAIDDRARAAMEAKVAEMELERDALHREREEVGSAVFENGRLTERVDALASELEAAKVKIAESERRTEEAARVAARERIRARKFSDEYETIRRDAAAREAELRIELTSAANHPMIGVTTVEIRELKAKCRDLKAENKRAKGEIDRIAAEAKKDVEDLKTKLGKAVEAANKAKAARIRARKAGEARTAVEEDLAASNALGDALTAELREREEELTAARAELERRKSDVLGLAQAERNAASLLMEGKRVWVSLEANLREQIASAEGRRVEAEARCVSIASTADRQIRLAEEESHELRAAMTPGGTKLATEPTQDESVDDLRGKLRKALDECAEANERARDAEEATRAAQAKIESMKWPKSLTSPNAGGDAGTDSCLVDRAADQRVATLRWYAAALNSRRSSAIARVESLEKDLVDAKAESADAKSSMLEAASKVRECAMESEANAAARRLLERDLSTTKADLAKARKLNVEGQMNRSSLRIELAEAKASVDAMASAMAQTQVPSDTPDAHRARESLVKRVGTTSSPSSPQFMSATVVSATKTVRLRSSSTSSTPTNPATSPRPATKTSYSNPERNIGQPRGGKESDPGRDILAGAVSHADDVSHAALRARLHASTKANDEIRRLCETYARDAASAEAKALGAAREIDDARRDAAEAAAVSAEAKRQVATLESRVARAEGGVADAAVRAVKAGCEAAAARADAAAARAQLRAHRVAGVEERGGEGTREGQPTSESPSGVETSFEEVAARLEFAEDAVAEALASRAESDAALSDGAASLASVIAERNALGSRCQSLVDSIASLRASVGECRAETFEARRDADAQKSRADACEHVASRLDAELEAVFARLSSASASNGEGDASIASEARLAIAKAQLLHKKECIRAADASLATQRARVEDAERRTGRACADAENAWGALRDARRFSVDRAVGGTDEDKGDKGDDELGDATRRLEECEAERAALATSLDEAIRDVSVLTDDLARERAKVAGERARADAAVSALGKMETDKCAEVPAAGGDAAIAAAAAERARCVALASANVDLHAHVAELAKMPGIGDETARETAEKRLADLGVGVDVRDATDSARTAATTCAVLQTELVDVTRQLEEVTREMERMKRDKAEARERRRKFDLASPGVKSPSPTTPLNDSRLEVRASDSKLADCEARLAAANARVSFLESALVRHGASSKDGTPLGTPLGTPTKGKVLTPTPKSPLDSDVDDLRTRLAAATRRADSAEAAAAEAEATAEAASRAAVDADAACAKIQKAAGDRASAAEARAHSAELEKTRLTDELLDARVEAHRAAVDAAAARAALDEASESIGEAQTGAHSTHVELVEARMEVAKVRGEGALALFELARTQVTLLADGDVDGARTAAESAMDDSRDAARVWSERAARGGDGSGSAGGSMSGPAASLLESGGVASRAQQLMADALAEEMGMH